MAQDPQDFLRRWSQRKLDTAAAPAPAKPAAEPATPPLPSPDSLTFESDFKVFMHAKVEQGVKRAALKKLFSDPHFNVMDGLDVYIDDYSQDDPIPQAMMASLEHAKATLFGREEQNKQDPEPHLPQSEDVAQAPAAEPMKKEDDGAAG
ncbi:MAG: DUF3306 domain-containing protein [Burkholderiales bacterium]